MPLPHPFPRPAGGAWMEALRGPRRRFLSYLCLAMCTDASFCLAGYARVHKQALAGSPMHALHMAATLASRAPSVARCPVLIPHYHPTMLYPTYGFIYHPTHTHGYGSRRECDCRSQAVPATPGSLLSPASCEIESCDGTAPLPSLPHLSIPTPLFTASPNIIPKLATTVLYTTNPKQTTLTQDPT